MATIKFKRGSGVPTGLTAYEAAWDTSLGRFFIHNGTTATWIGARIDPDTTLVGNCAYFVPTQNAVKTYVDAQVAGGAVSSINGATGTISILGGTGISIVTNTANKGITVSVSSLVALTDKVNTFTDSQIIQGSAKTLQVQDSISSDYILLDPNSNTINYFDNGTSSLLSIKAGGFGNNTITLPGSSGTVALREIAQTFTALQNFSSGISASGGTFSGRVNVLPVSGGNAFIDTSSGSFLHIGSTGSSALVVDKGSEELEFWADGALQGYFNASGLFVTDGLGSLSQVATTRTSVASLNGVTGAVNLFAGTGLSVASSTSIRGITFTNTGVLSIDGATGAITNVARTNVGQTFTALQSFSSGISASGGTLSGTFNLNGSSILTSANAVTSVDGVTGAVDLLAGTGISITLPTGAAKGITLANTGVIGITGTANQVAVNATTGSVTLSLPSAITTPGSLTVTGNLTASSDLTVTGNLTVNGTSTTVNSTTVTVQDPLIAIGGLTGNIPPVTGDVKDRGILYQYFSTVGRTGFFGHDTSTGRFTYLPFVTSVSSDVVTGTAGIAEFSGVYAPQGILELTALSGSSPIARITVDGTVTNGSISYSGNTHTFGASPAGPGTVPSLVLASSLSSSVITSTAAISQKTFTLPNISGTALVADAAGATSGWLLRAAGPSTQSTWVNPNAAGFTAFTSTNIITTSDTSDQVCFVTFVNTNTDGSQSLRYNSGFTYNAQTNYLEVNIDGGAY
jgi:hypothetical protein